MKSVVVGLSAFLALSSAPAAFAGGGSYDGQWAIHLVTMKGNCDRALSLDVGVAANHISDNGAFGRTSGAVIRTVA